MPRPRRQAPLPRFDDEVSPIAVWRLSGGLYGRPEGMSEAAEILDRGLRRDGEVWRIVGDIITADWVELRPGTRPPGFWSYGRPEPRPDGESEQDYLDRHNLWLPGERERLP